MLGSDWISATAQPCPGEWTMGISPILNETKQQEEKCRKEPQRNLWGTMGIHEGQYD